MANTKNDLRYQRRKRQLATVVLLVGLALVFLGAMEVVARLMGRQPYQAFPAKISVEPGSQLFRTHPKLGYTHLPGKFTVNLPSGHSFAVTHLTNTLRATHPADWPLVNRPAIWVMGGSYVYGWSLNDAETMPWQLQQRLAGYEVHNFGINGYGTLHSLLQFREFLPQMPKPACVVVDYAYFDDECNTLLRQRCKEVAIYSTLGPTTQPWARLNKAGAVDIFLTPQEYQPWPGQGRSALINVFEDRYCQWEDRWVHSQWVSVALLKQFAAECKKQGIKFVVAGITPGHDNGVVLRACAMAQIHTVDISVNLSAAGSRNVPHSDHPSARTQAEYARKLGDYLCAEVFKAQP
ncbi:MAG: SGNH/GDSL hydrolase family protein [Verrucomicrobiota bacterium]